MLTLPIIVELAPITTLSPIFGAPIDVDFPPITVPAPTTQFFPILALSLTTTPCAP